MNETSETGGHLLPAVFLAIYWAYIFLWYERRKRDGHGSRFNSGLPPPASDAAVRRRGNTGNDAVSAERDFDEALFLDRARCAYEFIIANFAAGKIDQIVGLLGAEVFRAFSEEVAGKVRAGRLGELHLVALDSAEIVAKKFDSEAAMITVRFESEIFLSPSEGAADGSKEASLIRAVDLWTFRREHGSRNPVWTLVATDAE